MAEVNAACDRWITEIRSGARRSPAVNDRPVSQAPPVADESTIRLTDSRADEPLLRTRDVLSTLGLLVTVAALTILIVGATATSLAVGLLLGSGAAAMYMVALRRLGRPGRLGSAD
jgi:hypothetical protein